MHDLRSTGKFQVALSLVPPIQPSPSCSPMIAQTFARSVRCIFQLPRREDRRGDRAVRVDCSLNIVESVSARSTAGLPFEINAVTLCWLTFNAIKATLRSAQILSNNRRYRRSQLIDRKAICRLCVRVDAKLTQDLFGGETSAEEKPANILKGAGLSGRGGEI